MTLRRFAVGPARTHVTDDRGEFSVELDYGWSGSIRPRLPMMIVEPRELVIDFLREDSRQDFTVTQTSLELARVQELVLIGAGAVDPPPTPEEMDQIDRLGNRNGAVDLGDYRAIVLGIMARAARRHVDRGRQRSGAVGPSVGDPGTVTGGIGQGA